MFTERRASAVSAADQLHALVLQLAAPLPVRFDQAQASIVPRSSVVPSAVGRPIPIAPAQGNPARLGPWPALRRGVSASPEVNPVYVSPLDVLQQATVASAEAGSCAVSEELPTRS